MRNSTPSSSRELRQRLRHGARAADWIPHAFVSLHVRDAAKHGGRTVGRRADILGEVVDHLGDARIGRECAHRARDGAAHAHREHVAEHLGIERRLQIEHVAQTADGFVEKVALARCRRAAALYFDEIAITRAGVSARSEAIERLRHLVRVLRKIEN